MAKILTHNQTRHGLHGTDAYKLWCSIVKRCEIESSSSYKYYGKLGIKICKEWRLSPQEFCEWALNNGYKKGLTIDRINRNRDYSPNNCHFITHSENCGVGKRKNKRNKSGYTGIYINKFGTYEVNVSLNGKSFYAGSRKTIEDALSLRDSVQPKYKQQEEVLGNIHDKHVL